MLRIPAITLIALTAVAQADPIDTSVDFTQLSRDSFVKEARALAQASWVTSMAMFSRIDPTIAEVVPAFPWNDAFEAAYGCVHDDMSAAGTLAEYNDMRDEGAKFFTFLEANPEVTILNIDQYNEALDLMTPSVGTIQSMQGCGVMDLNQEVMIESGLMQTVMQFYAAQQQ
ncbi:MAG: hypothetical protein AAFY25_09600 [Pseudomonadota bacterium]